MCANHEKERGSLGYHNLTPVAWSILVMGLSLAPGHTSMDMVWTCRALFFVRHFSRTAEDTKGTIWSST